MTHLYEVTDTWGVGTIGVAISVTVVDNTGNSLDQNRFLTFVAGSEVFSVDGAGAVHSTSSIGCDKGFKYLSAPNPTLRIRPSWFGSTPLSINRTSIFETGTQFKPSRGSPVLLDLSVLLVQLAHKVLLALQLKK